MMVLMLHVQECTPRGETLSDLLQGVMVVSSTRHQVTYGASPELLTHEAGQAFVGRM